MARNKNRVSQTKAQNTSKSPKTVSPIKTKKSWLERAPRLPLFVTLFILLWAFLYIWYGDVMKVAEQRSFFAFDSTAMEYYTNQSLGYLFVIGRFLLLSCVVPLLGTLLISIFLALAAWWTDCAFRLKGWWHVCSLIVPFCYIIFMFYRGLNLVYLRELSWIMTIPLLMAIVTGLVALVTTRKFGLKSILKHPAGCTSRQAWGLTALLLLFISGCVATAETYAQNTRITCAMECKMYDQDWDGMVQIAKSAHQPSRTVAAYYALALNMNGQMSTELFNLPYQYKDAHISRKDGSFDGGMDYIVVDCNFYAGLTRPAYHEAMEQMTLDGPSVHYMKRMVQCAVIDGEQELAEKYLAILNKVPFESTFVEKYSELAKNPQTINQEAELASVKELQPVSDNFEQNLREPMFLGYNVSLVEAQSLRGMYNSLYACLYSKDMQAFMQRVRSLYDMKAMVPSCFEEAIVVANLKNLAALKPLGIKQTVLKGFQDFMGDCFNSDDVERSKNEVEQVTAEVKAKKLSKDAEESEIAKVKQEHKTKEAKKKSSKWIDKYLGTYQFYYYFQNAPDENYILPGEAAKGGVN